MVPQEEDLSKMEPPRARCSPPRITIVAFARADAPPLPLTPPVVPPIGARPVVVLMLTTPLPLLCSTLTFHPCPLLHLPAAASMMSHIGGPLPECRHGLARSTRHDAPLRRYRRERGSVLSPL